MVRLPIHDEIARQIRIVAPELKDEEVEGIVSGDAFAQNPIRPGNRATVIPVCGLVWTMHITIGSTYVEGAEVLSCPEGTYTVKVERYVYDPQPVKGW
jgi:hypothetical protein